MFSKKYLKFYILHSRKVKGRMKLCGGETVVMWNVDPMCRFDLNCRMYQSSGNC